MKRQIHALIFPGFELLDLFGPHEMFGMLEDEFELHMVAETKGAVPSSQGTSVTATRDFSDSRDANMILIPGGGGTDTEQHNVALLNWIRECHHAADITMSVCTGSILLAAARILDAKPATTNKLAFNDVAKAYPRVNWKRHARWVHHNDIYTSSGVSAGMDMSLQVISDVLGRAEAEKAAKWAEYVWNDDPDNDPFA